MGSNSRSQGQQQNPLFAEGSPLATYANMISPAGVTAPSGGYFTPVQPTVTPAPAARVASTAPGTGTLPDPGPDRAALAAMMAAATRRTGSGRGAGLGGERPDRSAGLGPGRSSAAGAYGRGGLY